MPKRNFSDLLSIFKRTSGEPLRSRFGLAPLVLASSQSIARQVGALLLISCGVGWSGTALPYTFSATGRFSTDDQRAEIGFTVAAPSAVTLHTWSFGGGINGAGIGVPNGGFAPVVSLFETFGSLDLIGLAEAGVATCRGNTDTLTSFCWDVSLTVNLVAGSYLAVLTQDDNLPFGPSFADGFIRDGQGDFTGPAFLGGPGQFILLTRDQRTGDWALDIDLPGSSVPAPGTLGLFALGLILLHRRCMLAALG